jgi:hypothetical protein
MNKEEALRRIEAAEKEIAEAKKALDETDELKPGDWCVFWDSDSPFYFDLDFVISKYSHKTAEGFYKEIKNNDLSWYRCRRINPEDFGWKLDGKPSWKDAPEWANFVAQDEGGSWWYYAKKPCAGETVWENESGNYGWKKNFRNPNWRETLERRPE